MSGPVAGQLQPIRAWNTSPVTRTRQTEQNDIATFSLSCEQMAAFVVVGRPIWSCEVHFCATYLLFCFVDQTNQKDGLDTFVFSLHGFVMSYFPMVTAATFVAVLSNSCWIRDVFMKPRLSWSACKHNYANVSTESFMHNNERGADSSQWLDEVLKESEGEKKERR